jgi:hypothetical protein
MQQQVQPAQTATIIPFPAHRVRASNYVDPRIIAAGDWCEAADSSAWYHADAIKDKRPS